MDDYLVHQGDLERLLAYIRVHSQVLPDGNLEVHYPDGGTEVWIPVTGDFVPDPAVDCGFAWLELLGRYWRLPEGAEDGDPES